jgi:hypothetical protein
VFERREEMNVEKIFQQVMDEVCKDPLRRFAELVAADALAQPEQEPVAWMVRDCIDGSWYPCAFENPAGTIKGESKPLYTTPPSKPWVNLTDEEIAQVVGSPLDEVYLIDFRRVMKKLKEKNT